MFPSSFVEGLGKSVKVVAFANYTKGDEDELTFSIGDVITIIQTYEGSEWALGKNDNTGDIGMFPTNFAKERN